MTIISNFLYILVLVFVSVKSNCEIELCSVEIKVFSASKLAYLVPFLSTSGILKVIVSLLGTKTDHFDRISK